MALFVRRVIFGIVFATMLGQAVGRKAEKTKSGEKQNPYSDELKKGLQTMIDKDGDGTSSSAEVLAFVKKQMETGGITDPKQAAQAKMLLNMADKLTKKGAKVDMKQSMKDLKKMAANAKKHTEL
eukprot:TRINITY_DN440_c0_g1_i1.p2 TRINITY_DN440_c0_g1~~TRINITY_DN440_c0_g1_i1.p2  ORF type:complete len:125 (+),score=28.75 TRINITY_DN440_c0_g1_i1:137-511(+)